MTSTTSSASPPHGLPAIWEKLTGPQRRAIARVLLGRRLPHDIDTEFADTRTFGQRVSDRIAAFGGSWPFIGLAFVFLVGWVLLNSVILARRGTAFDPYPYILLNLFLSMLAALQAPVIMMSQNRQAARDRLEASHDYEVNLKAEVEIQSLHEKLDALRARDWAALVEMQQEQIRLLQRLLERATGEAQ
jgi:uncharacterized membrane protein